MYEHEVERQRLMARIINRYQAHEASAAECLVVLEKWSVADLQKLMAGLEDGLPSQVQIPKRKG